MRQAVCRCLNETDGVRERRMEFESFLVDELGVDGEFDRLAQRFEGAIEEAAGLPARRLGDGADRFAELIGLAGARVKRTKK